MCPGFKGWFGPVAEAAGAILAGIVARGFVFASAREDTVSQVSCIGLTTAADGSGTLVLMESLLIDFSIVVELEALVLMGVAVLPAASFSLLAAFWLSSVRRMLS